MTGAPSSSSPPSGPGVTRATLDDLTLPPATPEALSITTRPTVTYALPWVREVLEGRASPPRRTYELHPGLIVPETRCRIVRWIADGGMGVVYEAVHEDLGRHVALKVLRPEYSGRDELAQQFREEARAATRIGSEHIVQVHDFGTLPDGRFFFTMELLAGVRLSEYAGTFATARLFAVLRQIAKALAGAHDAGVVHRDLKPDNVMLTVRDDRSDFVKVMDFGLATMQGGEGGVSTAGTPTYMAPELVLGLEFDHRVDIYALGCTGFELLTGRPPFDDEDQRDVLLAHLERPPPRPSTCTERPIPSALENVIMRCLEKDPDARYADMRALEVALVEAQLEARVATTWDDLPLPRMDPDKRARLEAELRGHGSKPRGRARPRWPLVAAAAAALGAGSFFFATRVPEQAPVTDERVEQMARAAYDAAAKASFVYPPADAPNDATAFMRVIELEGLDTEGVAHARERSLALRDEFAATLVRLGNEFWDADGGRPFAIDYYAQAQLFAALPPEIRERLTLTPGELAALRDKAARADFTEAELLAAEPLAVLAQVDPNERLEGRRRLAGRSERRSATTAERLDRLLAAEPPLPATPPPARPSAVEVPAAPPPTPDAAIEIVAGDADADADADVATPSEPAPVRDPKRAATECSVGEAALRVGRLDEAAAAFSRALGFDRRSARALIGVSDVHFERGTYGKAAVWAAKAVAAAPEVAAYRVRLGDAYFKVHRYGDARTAYAKALALGDASAQARLDKVTAKLGG